MKKRTPASSDDWDMVYPDWGRILDDDLRPIRNTWRQLLAKTKTREESLHAFLAKHAQMAFADELGFSTVVSKLRLGADLTTDFVSVYDNWSLGIRYKLIEIERPDTVPFTKEGIPSSGLSRAIQQILSWRQWIEEHQTEARRIFPSFFYQHSQRQVFRYEIIIGTRANSEIWLDRRNMLSETLGITIRSFDSIMPRLRRTLFFSQFSSIGDEKHKCDLTTRNLLSCPFVSALPDAAWREMIRESHRNDAHFMGWYGNLLVKYRKENEYADRFRRLLSKRHRAEHKLLR